MSVIGKPLLIAGAKGQASGPVASFRAASKPLAIVAQITPVQSGSGDPSPTNVRPISGWTAVHIYHSGADTSDPTPVTFTFPGTVYGGTLAIAEDGSVTLTKTWDVVDLGTLTWNYLPSTAGDNSFRATISWRKYGSGTRGMCETYKFWNNRTLAEIKTMPDLCLAFQLTNTNFWIRNANYTDASLFKQSVSGVKLLAERATPTVYTLTPITPLTALAGENNLWADSGDTLVNYIKQGLFYLS